MNPIRKTLLAATAAAIALSGPIAVAEAAAKPRKCSAVQREFFPWECR